VSVESIVIVCPDRNVRLWSGRTDEEAMGGGKSSILQLADAWARAGHEVTIAGASVRESEGSGLSVRELARAAGAYDVGVYVTGSAGHFRDSDIEAIRPARRLFWLNGPNRVEPPPVPPPIDWYVAPAAFVARRAVDDWGHPPARVVVIRGEAVRERGALDNGPSRDPRACVYASHPFKGLREAVHVLARLQPEFPDVRLDVYGSERLWSDGAQDPLLPLPEWARRLGDVPQAEVERAMGGYGLLLYLTEWVDGFSLSTAEALAAGVVVIATAHGANAELVRHGWNGFLVRSESGRPDLLQAESLARGYLANPSAFEEIRRNAAGSVATWDEQAEEWRRLWRAPLRGR